MPKLFASWSPSAHFKMDHRWMFIEQFIRYKMRTDKEPPEDWQTLADWIEEFDQKRNAADIQLEKKFQEHMNTCNRPTFIAKDWLEKAQP
jgi:hypothetical protein